MDLALAALAASLALGQPSHAPVDPPLGPVAPESRIAAARIAPPMPAAPRAAPRDTVIEYSKAYYTRLTIHRWGSYLMLPLFATQVYLGSQLYDGEDDSKDAHEMVALGIGALFVSNTTTGLMNLWAMRADPNDRKRRLAHVTLMLLADAGFVATGMLADDASDGDGRSTHRAVALTSMALSTTGWLIMTDLFRKD